MNYNFILYLVQSFNTVCSWCCYSCAQQLIPHYSSVNCLHLRYSRKAIAACTITVFHSRSLLHLKMTILMDKFPSHIQINRDTYLLQSPNSFTPFDLPYKYFSSTLLNKLLYKRVLSISNFDHYKILETVR